MTLSDSTLLLSASPALLFLGKVLACGIIGFFILSGLRLIIDACMNPKGWKFGNELYDHEEDPFMSEENPEPSFNFQFIRKDDDFPVKRK